MNKRILLIAMLAIWISSAFAQKTYFIKTDRPTQKLSFDGQKWNGAAFFTIPSDDGLHQVIVKEDGYKKEFDILQKDMGRTYSTSQQISIDTNIIAIIKPIELNFLKEGFDFKSYATDYTSYMKDLVHDGVLQDHYSAITNEGAILNMMKADNQYLINELNEYHNNAIGRYRFYTLATIKAAQLYHVEYNKEDKFIQIFVDVDWSITSKNTEGLEQHEYKGKSGKILFPTDESLQQEALTLAINDAVFSSLLSFIADQQVNIMRSMQ